MGLKLTGKGSILNTLGNAVVQGTRDVGDIGSLGIANLTNNQKAAQNARNAIGMNNANIANGNLGANAASVGREVFGGPEQAINTLAAAGVYTGGLGGSLWDTVFGTQQQANKYATSATNRGNQLLRHGLGGVGGVASPEDLQQGNIVAPIARGVGDVAPFVLGPEAGAVESGLGRAGVRLTENALVGSGANAASQYADTGKVKASDVLKSGATNAVLGEFVRGGKTAVKAAKENTIPLNEVGGINNAKVGPSVEDTVHENNPLRPPEPKADIPPEPTPAELRQSDQAAQQIDNPGRQIDYSKVDGSIKQYNQAVDTEVQRRQAEVAGMKEQNRNSGKTDLFKRIRAAGGIGSSDFEDIPTHLKRTKGASMDKVAQEIGFKSDDDLHQAIQNEEQLRRVNPKLQIPKAADVRAAAEKYVAEHPDYAELRQRVDVEKELNNYEAADRQSGYSKVRVRNAPAGTPREIPAIVKQKINSPEYQAKRATGDFLQRVRDELPAAKAEVAAIDKEIKRLSVKGDANGIRDLNTKSASARLRLRYLQGQEKATAGEYGRHARALDEAYPDAVLRQPGSRAKTTVSEVPVKAGGAHVRTVAADVEKPAGPYSLEEVMGHPLDHKPYEGPNLNEGAFSREDMKNLEEKYGIEADESGLSYSPESDSFIDTPAEPPARNLEGDTAAFDTIKGGGSMDDAVKAYQKATGASEKEAAAAVNRVAETGVDMGTNEEVLKRNPLYDKVPDFEPKNTEDVADKVNGYRDALGLLQGQMERAAKGISENDMAALDQLRGKTADEVINSTHVDNPDQFREVAQAAKNISDYSHELRRLNGDPTIYRQNYGAGTHFAINTPEELASLSGYRDTLASTPGFSEARVIGDYGKAANEYGLERKNANFLEDVGNDVRKTLAYSRDRAIFRGLQDIHGNDSVNYGSHDFNRPNQLNGTKNVFTSPEVAKEWNKLNPDRQALADRNLPTKVYDAVNSGVQQAIVFNPIFHGSNQLWQALEASGRVPGMGKGGAGFIKNIASMSSNDMQEAALGIYEHGGTIPDYGKNSQGMLARASKNLTNLNRRGMASIEFRFRTGLYKTLTDGGMEPRAAVRELDKFMGDRRSFDLTSRRFTIFLHYFKTLANVQKEQILHPIKYRGTIANKVAMLGGLYALNSAWQAYTGNKHAYVRAPGGAGLIKEEVGAAENVAKGHYRQALSILTNRINPIPKEAAQQLLNRDLFTGQDLSGQGRGSHAVNTLVSPAQIGSKVMTGKKSPGEVIENQLQLNTPHSQTAPAAPSGRANFLNQKTVTVAGQSVKVKPAQGKDPTGIDQQNAYYDTVENAKKALPAARQKLFDQITGGETDANGDKVGMNEKQARAHYDQLAANPDILNAITQQKRDYAKATGTGIDPLYDSKYDSIRKQYALEQSTPYKGDDYTNLSDANKTLFQQLGQDRSAYFDKQNFIGPASQRVKPPQFDSQTEADLTQADGLTGTDKAQFIADHSNVQNAYDQIAKYTNDRRIAQGFQPFKLFPKADPGVQAIINEYMGLPQHDGKQGGNAARFAWAQAHPDEYSKMQNYFANVSEFELANSAGKDKYQGATPSQQFLKSAYSLGKYDIYKDPSNGVYSINPSSAYAAGQNSGASKALSTYVAQVKNSARVRAGRNFIKYQNSQHGIRVRTNSQNKRAATRGLRVRTKAVKVAAKTGKLRVRSATV